MQWCEAAHHWTLEHWTLVLWVDESGFWFCQENDVYLTEFGREVEVMVK